MHDRSHERSCTASRNSLTLVPGFVGSGVVYLRFLPRVTNSVCFRWQSVRAALGLLTASPCLSLR
jgi:hypothetical protein